MKNQKKSKQKKQQDNNDFWNDCLNEKIIDLKIKDGK